MFSSVYFYLAVVLLVFAAGDLVSRLTKGKLSGIMMVMLFFLVGFLTGIFPADIIEKAGLSQISSWAVAMLLFNMGTTLNVRQLIREWKIVVFAAICMLASCITMLLAAPLIGFDTVLVGMPVINGAAIATRLMTEAALEKGLTTAAALCAVIYSVQKFVGAPIASAMGVKYAKKLMVDFRKNPKACMEALKARQAGNAATVNKERFCEVHKDWYSGNVMLAIVGIACWLAQVLGAITPINYSIWALIFGSLSGIGGVFPSKPLNRAGAYGLVLIGCTAGIIPALANVSPSDLVSMAFQTITLFVTALIGIIVVSYVLPIGRLLVKDKDLAMGIGVEQFLGFPINAVICAEVASVVGENEEEKTYIEDTLTIPYVIGGITIVTVLSVVVAGIIINLL